MAETPSISALLDQAGWIRSLARSLVADPSAADDLVQDAWVSALESEPDPGRPLRGWLATVLRNRRAKGRARDAARAEREREAGRGGASPSAHDVVEKAAVHRDLVEAVLALDEPYRRTILLRFFEQLSHEEIARRTGATRSAVNSRVTRGLERLRRRLDASHDGDRRAWLAALIPLADPPAGLVPQGALPMQLLIGSGAAALLAATAVAVWTPEPSSEPLALRFAPPEPVVASAPALVLPAPEPEAARAAPPPTTTPGEPAEPVGLVLDDDRAVELRRDLQPSPEARGVSVSTGAGDVEIAPAAGGRVSIRARVSHDSERQVSAVFDDHVEVVERDGVLSVRDAHEGERGWSVSLRVEVPAGMSVAANSGAGDIEVSQGARSVDANSGAGDVHVAIEGARLESVTVASGAGDLHLRFGTTPASLTASSGAGDVHARLGHGELGRTTLSSGAGDVHAVLPTNVVGSFDLETGTGDLTLPPSLGLTVEREGTRQRARGDVGFGGGGRFQMRSGAGDVSIELDDAAQPL